MRKMEISFETIAFLVVVAFAMALLLFGSGCAPQVEFWGQKLSSTRSGIIRLNAEPDVYPENYIQAVQMAHKWCDSSILVEREHRVKELVGWNHHNDFINHHKIAVPIVWKYSYLHFRCEGK